MMTQFLRSFNKSETINELDIPNNFESLKLFISSQWIF